MDNVPQNGKSEHADIPPVVRRPIIGVMGGADVSDAVQRDAERLGELVAGAGWILLNGGRAMGVMGASARGARRLGGVTIGILPFSDSHGGAVSEHVSIPIYTGLGDARNIVNVLSSDVIVACEGSHGTLSEIAFALMNSRPVVLMGFNDHGHLSADPRCSRILAVAAGPEEALKAIRVFLGNPPRPQQPGASGNPIDGVRSRGSPNLFWGRALAEALGMGLAIFSVGLALALGFGDHPFATAIAYISALASFPAMLPVARWHLRNVAPDCRPLAGFRLAGVLLAVQFALDAAAFAVAPHAPPGLLASDVRVALVPPLLLAYSALLFVPWAVGSRTSVKLIH